MCKEVTDMNLEYGSHTKCQVYTAKTMHYTLKYAYLSKALLTAVFSMRLGQSLPRLKISK